MPKPKHRSKSVGTWLALAASTCCVAVTVIAAGAVPSFAAGTYSTTAIVNVRSGPGTGYPFVVKEPAGAQFTLQCQWQGGTSVNGNATWDKVTFANGVTGAITDYYTTTPSWNSYAPGTGACGSGSPSPPPSSSGNLGGVDMQRACDTQYPGRGLRAVATNMSSAYSWQCTGPGVSLGIDVTAECRTQYGYGAVSAVSNPGSAYCAVAVLGPAFGGDIDAERDARAGALPAVRAAHVGRDGPEAPAGILGVASSLHVDAAEVAAATRRG